MSKLIDFYSGEALDHRGRTIYDILGYSDAQLESVHDYIQLLFPLHEASRFQPDAPLLVSSDVDQFKNNMVLRATMRVAARKMVAFYQRNLSVWLTPNNHNFLRITRILRSLKVCGLGEEADVLFEWLKSLPPEAHEVIGDSMEFWKNAMKEVN